MCCVVEGRGPGWLGGCRRFDCPVSVRMPQMRWLTSASSAALMRARLPGWRMPPCRSRPVASLLLTGVTVGDFPGGGTALAGSLAEVTWGVGAGQGLLRGGECGGSRLVGSEKSPIVTRRRRVGLGGLIENVLSRRGLRSPTELAGGTSVICRKSQSSSGIAVPGMWLGCAVWRSRNRPPRYRGQGASPGRWRALCPRDSTVLQVTVSSGNGLRPDKVEPVRLKVVCSQVDRA